MQFLRLPNLFAIRKLDCFVGSYLAVEASSPALLGDKARIISWQREGAVSGECIGFWYHMYGVHIGALRVILKFEGGDEEEVWKMSGNKGDVWIYGNATIYSSNPYQVKRSTRWIVQLSTGAPFQKVNKGGLYCRESISHTFEHTCFCKYIAITCRRFLFWG